MSPYQITLPLPADCDAILLGAGETKRLVLTPKSQSEPPEVTGLRRSLAEANERAALQVDNAKLRNENKSLKSAVKDIIISIDERVPWHDGWQRPHETLDSAAIFVHSLRMGLRESLEPST